MEFETYIHQPNPDQKLWRYMSFEKFMYLIHRQSLFCPQAKKFEDPLEGFYSSIVDTPKNTDLYPILERTRLALGSQIVISCWHTNVFESIAMWKLYSSHLQGIAVQSTCERLLKSLDFSYVDKYRTGTVNYYKAENPLPGPQTRPIEWDYFYKRESFEYEKEFRIFCFVKDVRQAESCGGIDIPVDLHQLIERIYVSPKAERWVVDLIKDIVVQKYAIDVEVVQSELSQNPFIVR